MMFLLIPSRQTSGGYYRGADKSLARPGRKQTRQHVMDARDFNNIEMRAVIKFFFFLQGKAPKEIHAIQTETLACFLPGRAMDLSAHLVPKIRPRPLPHHSKLITDSALRHLTPYNRELLGVTLNKPNVSLRISYSEVIISHETTTMVVWIYDGI